jgi:hypothetical protein
VATQPPTAALPGPLPHGGLLAMPAGVANPQPRDQEETARVATPPAGASSMDRPTRVASGSVSDVAESLRAAGIDRLALINGHGGNYVLANVVQQANIAGLG